MDTNGQPPCEEPRYVLLKKVGTRTPNGLNRSPRRTTCTSVAFRHAARFLTNAQHYRNRQLLICTGPLTFPERDHLRGGALPHLEQHSRNQQLLICA
eukprot:854-Chlamydomonas_euryale.AAC.1